MTKTAVEPPPTHTRRDLASLAATLAVAGALVAFILYKPTQEAADDPLSGVVGTVQTINPRQAKGSKTAAVGMIEFADFECPFCESFVKTTLPGLEAKYLFPGRVVFAFQHLPLQKHRYALEAAEFASCAAEQGQFWTVHDRFFSDPTRMDPRHRDGLFRPKELDLPTIADCMKGDVTTTVSEQARAARALGMSSTPTFLFGTVAREGNEQLTLRVTDKLVGAAPAAAFERVLDRLLATKG